MYSLSYSPGDFNSSVGNYNAWMKTLIEVDWPVCFGSDHDNIPLAFKDKPPSKSSEEVESIRVYLNRKLDASTAVSTVDELNLIKTDTNAVCSVRIQKSGESHSESYLQRDKKVISNKGAVSAGNTDDIEVDFNIEHKGLSSTGSHKTPSLPVSFQNSLSKNKHDANELPLLVDVDNGVEIPGDGAAEIQRDFVEPKTCLPIPSCWQDIVRVSASNIPNAGNGLFAVRDLPAGVPLGFYFGVPMDENEYDLAKDHIGLASSYSIMYRKTVLDATDDNGLPFTDPNGPLFCPYHFMNEGGNISDCNISFLEGMVVNQIICFTTRLIKAGEELLVYYGSEVNRSKWECDT
ncbi:hypothetical protein AX774_g3348 [Zancudomyces culisetae]|uniref:SET domain-containing protein n=1 Tax=Zancudomyces culisetae TaxID=1213189 RepID=A0A1R1PQK3_ZANCU|nr:hypothetical protein AX774_g3348 [Zancudomyces culisetae]|eukprot:OMH83152.1 hypothetical protein AX774_g3348 [Zancudomyces culisetae]